MLKYNTNMTKKDLVDHANELQLRLNDELSTNKKPYNYEADGEQFNSFEDFLTHAVTVGMVDVSTFPTEEEQEAEAEEEMRIHKQKQADEANGSGPIERAHEREMDKLEDYIDGLRIQQLELRISMNLRAFERAMNAK